MLTALKAENIEVSRGGLVLAQNISFSLRSGEALLIEGPNGVGKTSLMKLIGKLSPLEQGSLSFEGIGDVPPEETLHYLGHENALRPLMTVLETAQFQRDLYTGKEEIAKVLALLGLAGLEDVPCAYLSAGQKRKLSFSRLLLSERPLWLLDEPLNALDKATVSLVHELIATHREKGGMVIAISHGGLDMPNAQTLSLEGVLA